MSRTTNTFPVDRGFNRPVTFSRHDQHNLELKVALACPETRETLAVDLFLFLPNSLHLQTWTRQELRHDFHSRLRLAIQQNVSRQESSVKTHYARIRDLLERFAADESSTVLEELFQKTRELGAVLGELLKHESRRLRSELLVAASRSNLAPHPEKILSEALESLLKIDRLVAEADELSADHAATGVPVIRLLRQYMHNLYTEFLIKLCQEQSAMAAPEGEAAQGEWQRLQMAVARLRQTEARRFQSFELQEEGDEQTAEELRLLRLSQIKKFFQSQMFIEVHRKETIRRFSEPAAAGAAAFAAMWAGAFEYFSQGRMQAVGLKGVVVICIGVALYVLKDRLKDQFRAVFTKKLAAILPEAEQSLLADGRKIGKVREWFSVRRLCDLPKAILKRRRGGDLTEAECHLPEEVLHYGQEFELEPSSTSYGEFERSIQQVVRVNIERFLKRLDDPYKTISLFDGEGELKLIRSHRIYHFHAAVVVRRLRPRGLWQTLRRVPRGETTLSDVLYRVVVDKNGVERVVTM
ncbi:MAG: hypothetical protein AB7N80_15380 [Bdellovibrionales bacterium]